MGRQELNPVHALEIIKTCVASGEPPEAVTEAARRSLELMRAAMVGSYHG